MDLHAITGKDRVRVDMVILHPSVQRLCCVGLCFVHLLCPLDCDQQIVHIGWKETSRNV